MERNQFWIFLALGLAVGACLEIMKAPSTQPIRLAGFTHFETILDEGKEVHVVEEVKPIVRRRAPREEEIVVQKIAANDAPTPEVMATNDTPTASPTPAPKPLTPEEKKKKDEDEKKKKELEKKKKLKAKRLKEEEEKKQRDTLEAQAKEDQDKQDAKPEGNGDAAATPDQQGAAMALHPPVLDDGNPKTVVEWESYLMKSVDYERMAKFVKFYQTGIVTAEVYYPVIEAMLQDSRAGIRALAIGGLSSTPGTHTYITLLDYRNDADPSVRNATKSAIAQYGHLENLRYLMAVIVGPYDTNMVIEAINTVRASADTNVKTLGITAQGTTTRAPAATALARYYTPFVIVLQQTSTQNHDANIRASALQSLTELQSVIATLSQAAALTTASNQPLH
jgi:hypothetical protein